MGEEAIGEEAMDERELRRGDFPLRRGEFFLGAMFAFRSTDWSALPIQRRQEMDKESMCHPTQCFDNKNGGKKRKKTIKIKPIAAFCTMECMRGV